MRAGEKMFMIPDFCEPGGVVLMACIAVRKALNILSRRGERAAVVSLPGGRSKTRRAVRAVRFFNHCEFSSLDGSVSRLESALGMSARFVV